MKFNNVLSVTATRFGVYGVAKRYWKSLTGRAEESFLSNFLFAGFAGACGALAGVRREVFL